MTPPAEATSDPISRAHELSQRLAALERERDGLSVERDRLVVQLRESHKLTVRDVAELLAMSPARVQQLVTRHRQLRAPHGPERPAGRDLTTEREAHYLRCEAATNGAMLSRSGQRKGIDPRDVLALSSLLTYASEELTDYLQSDPCPRGQERHYKTARRAAYDRSIA